LLKQVHESAEKQSFMPAIVLGCCIVGCLTFKGCNFSWPSNLLFSLAYCNDYA
jgi:hypothetical protein